MIRLGVVAFSCLLAGGCGDDGGGEVQCLEPLEQSCGIIWNDYDAIYRNLIMPRCGSGTGDGFCHATGGPTDLDLSDPDVAYQALLGDAPSGPRVIPGDPECSELIKRLDSKDPAYRMPRGSSLKPEELCSVVHWVSAGADR